MRNKSEQNIFANDQSGMAILMVTSAIALMTMLLAQFSFDTRLNSVKIYNYADKSQAKLNAEAGLKFALSKLKLYQSGHNKLEENEQLKKTIPPSLIQNILTQPFVYPIPLPKTANLIQKSAVSDFEKNNLIRGSLSVEMKPVSGFLNPNNMRVLAKSKKEQEQQSGQDSGNDSDDKNNLSPQQYIEKELISTLEKVIDDKREQDDDFATLYSNIKPDMLIKEIKYFINPKNSLKDPEVADFDLLYSEKGITPKHAPLTSLEELYLLAGWDDVLVNLMKDRLSVHEVSVIPVNEITLNQLKVLFPNITEIQLEEFFKHRDGDSELEIKPTPFSSAEDFKQLIVGKLGVMDDKDYDKKVKEFESAGLRIAVAGKLFKVISIGRYGNAEFKITALADLPVQPTPEEEDKKKEDAKKDEDPFSFDSDAPETDKDGDDQNNDPKDNDDDKKKDEDKKKPIILMEPRIISLQ